MASDDDLRINTRYALTKHSSRAILEEHDSCEVPAGCGGVVLRWRDPAAGRPGILRIASLGRARVWLDGHEVINSWVTLAPGRHVLAAEVRDLTGPAPFAVAISPGEEPVAGGRGLMASSRGLAWRVHDAPPDGWTAFDFDDRDWALARAGDDLVLPIELDTEYEFGRFRELSSLGADVLRLDGTIAAVRGTFTVEAP